MARFFGLNERLSPYGAERNYDRVEHVTSSKNTVAGPFQDKQPGLSIVILNLNRPDLVASLWRAIPVLHGEFTQANTPLEILFGDTGSTDPETLWMLDNPPVGTRIFRNLKYNFSRCNNDLFRESRYQTVLFLNNDVLIEQNSSAVKLAYDLFLANAEECVLSAVMNFENGLVQHAGIDFFYSPELFGFCYHPNAAHEWTHVPGATFQAPAGTGAFLMTSAESYSLVGGFDERYIAECQDVDLCLKFRRLNIPTVIADLGKLVHLENATRATGEENWDDRSLYIRRWSSFVETL
jgi:GT2 family glycosyltransferase